MEESFGQLTVRGEDVATPTAFYKTAEIELPNHFHLAAESLAKSMGLTKSEVLNRLLEVSLYVIAGLHRASHAHRKVPPPEWAPFVDALTRAQAAEAAEREADDKLKEKRRERDKIRYLNEKLENIDVSKLEKDNRNPTGFKGVYAYSSGFRAQVCRDGKARYLPTRSDAILSAQDRFEWYQRYGLPYGREEKLLALNPQAQVDPDLILASTRDTDDYMSGRGGFTDTSLQEHLDKIRVKRALAEAEDAKRGRGRPRKVRDVRAREAGIVTWLDEQRVVVEHDDGTALSYMPIRKVTVWMDDVVEKGGKLGEIEGANTRVLVHDVPPPSKLRGQAIPVPKRSPLVEGNYLDIPTAAERRALEPPAPTTAEAEAAKQALKALVRQQKIDIAKTPTEIESERIEVENEAKEEEIYFSEDDIVSIVDDVIASEESPTARPVIKLVKPEPPARPTRPVSDDTDDFFKG